MKICVGTNRLVIVGKYSVYKLPLGFRGIRANRQEYCNSINNEFVAKTSKHWYGLKQERLTNCKIFPRYVKKEDVPEQFKHLYEHRLHNRMQIGQDSSGQYKFFDYEDVKFYERHETEP